MACWMPRAATADSEKKKGVDGFGCSRRVVAATAPAQAMARKKPAAVNPGKRRLGNSAELAHYLGRISSSAQAPAIGQKDGLEKTVARLPYPPPRECNTNLKLIFPRDGAGVSSCRTFMESCASSPDPEQGVAGTRCVDFTRMREEMEMATTAQGVLRFPV
jgi:hypothetical protein